MATDCFRLRMAPVAMLAWLAVACPAHASPALDEGFETGAPAWTATGMWHVQTNPELVQVSPAIAGPLVTLPDAGFLPAAANGSAAAWFGQTLTGTYCGEDYVTVVQTPRDGCTSAQPQSGALTSPVFSLAGDDRAFVSYDAWWEIEAKNANRADLMRVEYTTDGGATWQQAEELNPLIPAWGGGHQSFGDMGARVPAAWQPHVAELSGAGAAAGVQVRFVFQTLDRERNGFRGLLIDDVAAVDEFGQAIESQTAGGVREATPGAPAGPGGNPPAPSGSAGAGGGTAPRLGKTFKLSYVSGVLRYHRPGETYVGLPRGDVMLPMGSVVDTRRGRARVTVESDDRGSIESGDFFTGAFGVFQRPAAVPTANIVMAAGDFTRCAHASQSRAASARRRRPVRSLWGSASGHFRTSGRFASATIRGTRWLVEDLCSATRITVRSGAVGVFDYRRKRTTIVRAGHSITVTALDGSRYRRRSGTHQPRLR